MNMKAWHLTLGVLLIIIAACIYNAPGLMSELKDKEVWATLQSVEAEHRETPAKNYIIISKAIGTQYDVLGVPTKSSNVPMAWMTLNEGKEDSPMKILPQGEKIDLSCLDAKNIITSTNPDHKVVKFLRSECAE
jgi:hypothetical protein